MREHEAAKAYRREIFSALALYMVVLVLVLKFGQSAPPGIPQALVMASPMIGFLLAVWAVVRQFGRMDEYVRRYQLENIAIAAAVTAGWTFTYGFIENAGYPRLSMFTVWPVMGAVWGGLCIVRKWIGR